MSIFFSLLTIYIIATIYISEIQHCDSNTVLLMYVFGIITAQF